MASAVSRRAAPGGALAARAAAPRSSKPPRDICFRPLLRGPGEQLVGAADLVEVEEGGEIRTPRRLRHVVGAGLESENPPPEPRPRPNTECRLWLEKKKA